MAAVAAHDEQEEEETKMDDDEEDVHDDDVDDNGDYDDDDDDDDNWLPDGVTRELADAAAAFPSVVTTRPFVITISTRTRRLTSGSVEGFGSP